MTDYLESDKLKTADALATLDRAYYAAVLLTIASDDPELARFDGETHQGQVDEFVRFEREHRRAARVGAMRAHHERIPHGGAGPVGVLKGRDCEPTGTHAHSATDVPRRSGCSGA